LTGGIHSELHFHLLPAVDDGPETLDEALELARLTVADGTGTVVCTPHVAQVDVATIPDRVRELQAALDREGIALRLLPGAEISPGAEVTDAELRVIAQGPAERRWVLLEAPLQGAPVDELHATADELEARGYGLLLAHPERSRCFLAPDGGLERRLRRGNLLQVNASSLTGLHGARARDAGIELIARGLVTVLASDAHRPTRPPRLTAALTVAGDATLVDDGPATLLERGIEPLRQAA
jgi:protein-tyrosine phosphatase